MLPKFTEVEMRYYEDLREYINVLESNSKLVRIRREINKDTELHPLVRWQFQGRLPEDERKAFLLESYSRQGKTKGELKRRESLLRYGYAVVGWPLEVSSLKSKFLLPGVSSCPTTAKRCLNGSDRW